MRTEILKYKREKKNNFDILEVEFKVSKDFSLTSKFDIIELLEAMQFIGKLGSAVCEEIFQKYVKNT